MQRKLRWLTEFSADFRFGARILKRNPGVALVGMLTLALGIGANTAIFSLLHAVLLRPLPYRDPGRLVWASQYAPRLDATLVPAATFLSWRDQNRSFEDLAAYDDHLCDGNLATGAEPSAWTAAPKGEREFLFPAWDTACVRSQFFNKGRRPRSTWGHDFERWLLAAALWSLSQRLGKSLRLDNAEYTLVGILPANFVYPSQLQPDAFVPLPLPATPDWSQRESDDMSVVARLKQDVPLQQAGGSCGP